MFKYILSQNQYGSRKNYSTTNKKATLSLFIDLSKAFDTVNHDILLDKLEHYGVRGIVLQWFKSYLSRRKQFGQYNGYNSSSLVIACAVPQGSILGPLVFLVNINDLCNVLVLYK